MLIATSLGSDVATLFTKSGLFYISHFSNMLVNKILTNIKHCKNLLLLSAAPLSPSILFRSFIFRFFGR